MIKDRENNLSSYSLKNIDIKENKNSSIFSDKNQDKNYNTYVSSSIFSGVSTKENTKLYNAYKYCINDILPNKNLGTIPYCLRK